MRKEDSVDVLLFKHLELSLFFQLPDKPATGVIWKDEFGRQIDEAENSENVKTKEEIEVPKSKYAEDDNDFEIIFQREFNNSEATDRDIFRKIHIKTIKRKLKNYLELSAEDPDHKIVEIATKYLQYLKNRQAGNEADTNHKTHAEPLENPSPQLIHNKVCKTFKLRNGITEVEVEGYYNWLSDNKDIDCTLDEFKVIFSNNDLPEKWNPIKWMKPKNKGQKPHLSALGAIIRMLLNVGKGNNQEELMKSFFIDKNGNPIKPSLPSTTNIERYLMNSKEKEKYIRR